MVRGAMVAALPQEEALIRGARVALSPDDIARKRMMRSPGTALVVVGNRAIAAQCRYTSVWGGAFRIWPQSVAVARCEVRRAGRA